MKIHIAQAVIVVLAGVVLATTAVAQCTSGTDVLQSVTGPWTFNMHGSLTSGPFAASGMFVGSTAVRAGNEVGILTITNTSSQNGSISSMETDAGTYQVRSDCSGGTLTFNLSSRPLQFDFWFVTGTQINFTSTTGGFTISGTAHTVDPGSPGNQSLTLHISELKNLCTFFQPTTAPLIANPLDLVTAVVQGMCTIAPQAPPPCTGTLCTCEVDKNCGKDFVDSCADKENVICTTSQGSRNCCCSSTPLKSCQ